MKTDDQNKQTARIWREAGFAKPRDGLTIKVFNSCIGTATRSRYNESAKEITAMEMAILDTMYDAGEGAEFKAKDLVNDHTRMAYVIDKDWSVRYVPDREQKSCGHDERDCMVYQIYEHYEDEEAHNGYGRRVIKQWYTDEEGCPSHDELNGLAEEQLEKDRALLSKDGSIVLRSRYSCYNTDLYRGECGWENSRKCAHHGHRNRVAAILRFIDKKTGDEKRRLMRYKYRANESIDGFNLRYWEDQDDLLADVSDDAVLAHIKATIPKLKTESREWLSSTWTEYINYNHELQCWNTVHHGKRGVYRLTWWSRDKAVRKDAVTDQLYEGLNDSEVNGWTFKKRYGTAQGCWLGEVEHYQVVGTDYRSTFNLGFRFKSQAEHVAEVINDSPMMATVYNVDGRPRNKVVKVEKVVKEIQLSHDDYNIVEAMGPVAYFHGCHTDTLLVGINNTLCHHEEE
jgi:hypothetical protein